MTPELIYRDDMAEVWLGDCLDPDCPAAVLGDRVANLTCVDAPYSEKTHSGHKNGKLTADRAAAFANSEAGKRRPHEAAYAARKAAAGESGRNDIGYPAWTPADVATFCDLWVPRCSGWCVSVTDDVLAIDWGQSFERLNLYRFAPLPLVETGSRVRMTGDGPSNWTCWIVAARPSTREFASWGTLRGAYVQPAERDINSSGGSDRIVGGKPLKAMIQIVEDYSRRGDLVIDQCCGGGTALMAAKMCGRRCVGIEKDRGRAELSARRLRGVREQRSLFDQETG